MNAIHIVDPGTCALVRQLAKHRSTGPTETVRVAVEAELAREGIAPMTPELETEAPTRRTLVKELDAELRATTLDYTRLRAKAEGKKNVGSRIYQMIRRHGAVDALQRLVNRPTATEGFAFLVKMDRLYLAVEAIAVKPKYASIVDEETRAIARKRLDGARGDGASG
jgi:hypothetical protein